MSGAAAGLGREGWGRLGASSRGDGAGMLGMPVSPDTAVEAAKGSEERSVEVLRVSSGSEPASRPAMQHKSQRPGSSSSFNTCKWRWQKAGNRHGLCHHYCHGLLTCFDTRHWHATRISLANACNNQGVTSSTVSVGGIAT